MIRIPTDHAELLKFANETVEQCRVSVGVRSAYYSMLNAIIETGRYDGRKSLINLMHVHVARLAAHIFSPVELKFSLDFENPYDKVTLDQAAQAAKTVTRTWARNGIDVTFGNGVFEALKYGACILKQWVELEGEKKRPVYKHKLVMPWQFGVYREDQNELSNQEALCETITLTAPEVWRRIYHMPGAKELFDRIMTHGRSNTSGDPSSFFHQVLSTSQLNTSGSGSSPTMGGVVQINGNANYGTMGPVIAPQVVQMHEIWVKDEEDYTTIQIIEPDILIAPLFKKSNLLIPGSKQQPYRLIQPNQVTNWFWGRSELVDMTEPQALLSDWADDTKRLFGLQIDKILGFSGETGMTDELYGQFRAAGFTNLGPGADIKDITPKMPPETIPMLRFMIEIINMIGGFPPIMQGEGAAGVRAGVHADTLLKTASPTQRDRALLVERQCAAAADLTFLMKQAKDSNKYWTKADIPMQDPANTAFLLSEIPEDWRVIVDSHSSSPIFSDENEQLIFQLRKTGDLDGEYAIDHLPIPDKDIAKQALRTRQAASAAEQKQLFGLVQKDPEMVARLAEKQLTGRK